MKRMISSLSLLSIVALIAVTGCDVKPAEPKTEEGRVQKVLSVDINDPAEVQAIAALESARINYAHRLNILTVYYEKVGNITKYTWAKRELKNLRTSQTFQWDNAPQIQPPEAESLDDADERLLVEYAVAARNAYKANVAALAKFLAAKTPGAYKVLRVTNMAERLDPVRTYLYFLDAEIPGPDLKPVEVDPEANQLYADALKLHQEGKGLLRTFVTTDYNKQRQALMKFLQLVRQNPRSTKVALAAFYIGEIYKEYFNENIRAVHWYQRAWQWDPQIKKPARFQAASVWDLRLQRRQRAIDLYRAAIEHEQFNKSNVGFARRRIQELMLK